MSSDVDALSAPLLAQLRMAAERVWVNYTAPAEPIPPRSRHLDPEATAFAAVILSAITPELVEKALAAAKEAARGNTPRNLQ